MTGQNSTNVWLCRITRRKKLAREAQIIPGRDGHLAGIRLVLKRVELEVARLSHDVDTSCTRIMLSLLPHTSTKCVDLLSFKVNLLANKVRITGRIGQGCFRLIQ